MNRTAAPDAAVDQVTALDTTAHLLTEHTRVPNPTEAVIQAARTRIRWGRIAPAPGEALPAA
jgi:hypothetical protein